MIRRNLLGILAVPALATLLYGPAAFAHGDEQHVMGTVKAIDEKSITVTTTGKKDVAVQLDPSTKFEKGGAAAKAADIAVGDRVVVHSRKGESGAVAALVKVGAAAAGKHGHAGK